VFTVWEKYANPQAVKDHLASDVFKQFAEEGGKGLFAAPPDIKCQLNIIASLIYSYINTSVSLDFYEI